MRGTVAIPNRGSICARLVEWLYALDRRAVHLVLPVGGEIALNRNCAVHRMLGDWLLFVDADCVPETDALDRLEAHDLPIVGGVVLERTGANDVCATRTFEPPERYLLSDLLVEPGVIRPVMSVLAIGTGCLMIQRGVLDAVPSPWFRNGQLILDAITEDTDFCLRAAERGFVTYLDPNVRVGHVVQGLLWPHEDGSPWASWEGSSYREPLDVA